ncbi:PREDICTED: uncharacterized protein LOC104799381 [Tarenaya hassleriana]|uniref:uncharacterized protein LOC104799381 n=1 Tax=Tarenaya hassleriana TaxID=28532 RepID=UPI00053C0F0E|nr:PREDICTED: uncharacterized protein LOC104799381 [Tarenaya hassleriana]
MCPLRLILIFLSASLAGFFLVRNLKSPSQQLDDANGDDGDANGDDGDAIADDSASRFSKVGMAMKSGFWTCVDMASGRYLWKHLSSSSAKRSS